jgi:hypothetical protein
MKIPDLTKSESVAPSPIRLTPPVGVSVKDKQSAVRILHALKTRPITREHIDPLAGCRKGRKFVAELHRLGHDDAYVGVKKMSRDLVDCWPDVYHFTQQNRRRVNRRLSWRKD